MKKPLETIDRKNLPTVAELADASVGIATRRDSAPSQGDVGSTPTSGTNLDAPERPSAASESHHGVRAPTRTTESGVIPVTGASAPSRTLLAILACGADNARLRRHWPYFKATGFTILGCGTADGTVSWPEPVEELSVGEVGRVNNAAGEVIFGLVRHELDIVSHFINHPEYDTLMVAEADNLFVRQPPPHPQNGMYLAPTIPNYARHGLFKTSIYFTTPRVLDQQCGREFWAHAWGMFERGDREHFVSDRFPSAVCHQGKIPWMHYPGWSPLPMNWPVGMGNDARWVRDARAAIQLGACCLHSVKTQEQLDAVKDLIPNVERKYCPDEDACTYSDCPTAFCDARAGKFPTNP